MIGNNRRRTLLVIAATMIPFRARWYAGGLITRAGRTLRPDSSEKTKPTRTTSPRPQAIIGGILAIVPQLGEQGVRIRV